SLFSFLLIRRPPRSPLFPYTRSSDLALGRRQLRARRTIELLVLAPIILPGIVLATGLGSMFIRLGLSHTVAGVVLVQTVVLLPLDRKSTRLNSSHLVISYAVFCLKKK